MKDGFLARILAALLILGATPARGDPPAAAASQVLSAHNRVAFIASAALAIQHQLSVARAERDAATAICVSDTLNQIHATLRSARKLEALLADAALGREAERIEQTNYGLLLLGAHAREIEEQADHCLGIAAVETGTDATRVTVEVDGRVAPYEPRAAPETARRPPEP